jgi:acetyltransferase-like isoleucine patch superfamily enzyme
MRWFVQKFYYEPVFKALCHSCGDSLKIDIGLPQISGHLQMDVGHGVTLCGINSFFSPAIHEKPRLIIGDNSYIGFQVSISVGAFVSIGDNCLTAARVAIMDNNNHPLDPSLRKRLDKVKLEDISPVVIEDNVWLGYQAFIGKGVTIGKGSIVAANSVVLKDVPPNTIVSGNPAKVVRQIQ